MSPEDVKNFLAKGSNFSGVNWRHLQNAQKELSEYQEKSNPPKPKPKHHEKWGKKI